MGGLDLLHLTVEFLVVDRSLHVAYHADGQRQVGAVHHRQLLVQEVALAAGVVCEHVVYRIAVGAKLHSLQQEAVAHYSALVVLAE